MYFLVDGKLRKVAFEAILRQAYCVTDMQAACTIHMQPQFSSKVAIALPVALMSQQVCYSGRRDFPPPALCLYQIP